MDGFWVAALAGVLAGLGVAMPLGAIGALLLRESIVNGFRVGAAAAGGVATVDLLYCAVATATGALLAAAIDGVRGPFLIASGILVIAIGILQLFRIRRPPGSDGAAVDRISALRAYARFVGLTAINPMTLIYFIALGGAVTARSASPAGPVVFVVAAGLASLAWQLMLAGAGALFGHLIGRRATRVIGVLASLIVVALGAIVLAQGAGALLER
ncbi:Threonine/homoserine/homoserine lactone efflux protein [Microbacterium sp. 8M]|uniref:LysE family transporter n=1 Tax=Microbacterium sp. 8M TaxID=2653153 RepID=UPI0012F02817|nr:LysE family transporter [Microbacterium sp. 8M]VXB76849.1 Threonine/homoserine/homoserine lactone efflux protein [Microbacterium sp. 8M]